jgi:hypothetical protein
VSRKEKQVKREIHIGLTVALGILSILLIAGKVTGCSSLQHTGTVLSSPSPAGEDLSHAIDVDHSSKASIDEIVERSSCARYSWKERRRAPIGYLKGMARAYGRTGCRWKGPESTVAGVIGKTLGPAEKDALTAYGLGGVTGLDRIRATYALGIGLGMRESSGRYCLGRDTAAGISSQSGSTCEAGAFQASYNSAGASSRLNELWEAYRMDSKQCDFETWREGVDESFWNCKTPPAGTGTGLEWQKFTRGCPAFAAEWAMALTRTLKGHFGPLKRKEVEYRPECEAMLREVEKVIKCQ